jgi:hypothetical protein
MSSRFSSRQLGVMQYAAHDSFDFCAYYRGGEGTD